MNPPAGHPDSTAGQIRLRYWAAIRAAAGVVEDVVETGAAVSLAELRARARQLHASSDRFAAVLETCSVLVEDRPVASEAPENVLVEPGQTVEFLPPFAGG
jgi:molybdopterin converting factor small subunit